MPFDGKVSDYFETKPAPVYGPDHAPQTMWDAIRLGVRDLEATERTPGYVIDMDYAHEVLGGVCAVCFAGSVMARTLNADPRKDHYWHSFPRAWHKTFDLLDNLRNGQIWLSDFVAFGIYHEDMDVTEERYETNPTAFKRDMLALADRLEREG